MSETNGRDQNMLPLEMYVSLIEDAPVGIYLVQDGRIIYGNRWLSDFSGYRVSELNPLNVLDVIHPEDRARVMEQMRLRLSGGAALSSYPVRFVKRNGTVCDTELYPLLVSYGGRPAIQGTLIDITAKVEVEHLRSMRESLERQVAEKTADLRAKNCMLQEEISRRTADEERLRLYAAALEGAAEGIYIVGLDGRILYVNKAAERWSGIAQRDYLGKNVSDLLATTTSPAEMIITATRRAGFWAGEVQGQKKKRAEIRLVAHGLSRP